MFKKALTQKPCMVASRVGHFSLQLAGSMGCPLGRKMLSLVQLNPHTTCRLVQMFPEVPSIIEKTRIDLEIHLLKIEKKKGKKINKREKSSLQENAKGKMEGIVKLDYHHSVTVTGITHPVRIPTFSNVGLQAPPHGH